MIWTDERIAELKGHIADKRSGREIGAIMGVTRNSIIGKAHRLGLHLLAAFKQGTPVRKEVKQYYEPRIKFAEVNKRLPPLQTILEADAAAYDNDRRTYAVLLTDLKDEMCHFPLWQDDTDAKLYCGAVAVEGCSWCSHHRSRCFIKSTSKTGTYINWRHK